MSDPITTICDNCTNEIDVDETHTCETCGATLCMDCICEDCENKEE